jgi:hypothetical protein
VLRALELSAYQSGQMSLEALAGEVGLSSAEVAQYLGELAAAAQAIVDGERYRVAEILTIDTRDDPEGNRRLKAFWASEALRRFESGESPAESLFSFNLFAISEEAFERIRGLHLAYYDQVRAIIDQSRSADRVVLMNLQLLPLRSAPPGISR